MNRTAVVTGASAGIGAATVRALAKEGFDVIAGARREDRLRALADETGCRWRVLDVTEAGSVAAFCEPIRTLDVLVNNAGAAFGLERIERSDDDSWRRMYELNVVGLVRMTRTLIPALEASGAGHVVNIGSVAGIETYEGGAGYTATKHAVRAVTDTLRLELLGRPVRVSEVAPGLVETEFSLVRFEGDAERARRVYEGYRPLSPEDIADCITWVVTRPPHVNIDFLLVKPLAQARAGKVHKGS